MVSRTPGIEPPRKRMATEAAAFSAARGWPKRFGDRYYSPPPRPRSRPPSPSRRAAEGRGGRGDAEEAGDATLGAWRGGAGKAEEAVDGSPAGRGCGRGGAVKSGVEARAGVGAAGGNAASDGDSAAGAAVAAPRERGGSVGGEVGSKRPFATVGSRSRVYAPPERRGVSATRSFPLGRGRGITAPLAGADDGLGLVPAPARPDGGSAALRKSATRPLSIEKAGNRRVPKKVSTPAGGALKIRDGCGGVPKEASAHAGSCGVLKKVSAHAARSLSIREAGSRAALKNVSAAVVSHPIADSSRHGPDAAARRSSDPSRRSAAAAADGFLDTGSKAVAEGGRFGRSKELVQATPLLPKSRNIPTIRRFQLEHRRVRVSQSLKSANKRPLKNMIVDRPAYLRMKVASACTKGSIDKQDDVLASIVEDDDFWKELDAYEESDHNVSSDVPSVRCQRQCGTQNTDARSKVEMMCKKFQFVLMAIVKVVERRSLKIGRIDFAAHSVVKNMRGFTKRWPIVGSVPGVEVGDQFLYKVEMALVGLHIQFRKGIDTTRDGNGALIAISIVASGRYPDELSSSGELIYTGSGGKLAGKKSDENQKLKGGNLALKNCIQTQTPVRVTFGFKVSREARAKGASAFIYDGLYRVVKCWIDGEQGSKMFRYKLQRIPGQPELPHSKTGIMRLGQ
ncbi:hypothetical protein HU200_035965 [Digitaria exilis]|uniref:YDG domain-containing protein n=1 Tax=Digitaria exilis TaxID=1010633 RepID=A0A835BHG5_9POAL|nr:hypothetical protein HU200_035965 [Digitaria exilis]CAB3480871.1 unnamed protein product [Digitaria exilis]CAB3482871.1 unnamed protein product [Digitaria exilis]